VKKSDYESVRDHVIDVLAALRDPENNRAIIDLVIRKEDHGDLHQKGNRIGDVIYFLNSPYSIFDGSLSDMDAAETDMLDRPMCHDSEHIFGAHVYYLPTKRYGPFSNSVPIIISGPDMQQGMKRNGFTELIDIAPTVSSILHIASPAQSQGKIIPLY
jgi:arylsulfatase A-like enzyme